MTEHDKIDEKHKMHWNNAMENLEKRINKALFKTWIRPLKFKKAELIGEKLAFLVTSPNDFTSSWVNDRFLDLIEKALREECDQDVSLQFSTEVLKAQKKPSGFKISGKIEFESFFKNTKPKINFEIFYSK